MTNSKASNYKDRISNLITNSNENHYDVINSSSNQVEYSFENPDFNFIEFRSNLVLRWEYRAGSQIYFVWSQERNNYLLPEINR